MKGVKLPNTSYTDQQKSLPVCTLDGRGIWEDSYFNIGFHQIPIIGAIDMHINAVGTRVITTMVATLIRRGGVVVEGQRSVRKNESRLRRCLLWDTGAVVGGTSYNCFGKCLGKKWKMFLNCVQIGQQISKHRQGKFYCFGSVMPGEPGREFPLLATHRFLWRVQFLCSGRCEQTEIQNVGFRTPRNCPWVTIEVTNVNVLVHYQTK